MKFANKLLFVVLLGLHGTFADAWSSGGGGEIRKDSRNPWFLFNTSDVSYCIEVNQSAISVSSSRIRQLIQQGFEYWKKELSESSTDRSPNQNLTAGKQTFRETSSCNQADIRFQFGSLDKEQRNYFEKQEVKITDFIALTIRTDYDKKILRGKGFIYFSADIAESEYFPKTAGINKNFWNSRTEEQTLRLVILHELGHVFGVPHFGRETELMGEDFPEFLIRNSNLAWANEKNPPKILSRRADNTNFVTCEWTNPIFRFFKSESGNCLRLQLDHQGRPVAVKFYRPDTGESTAQIALSSGQWSFQNHSENLLRVWLTSEQNLYPARPALDYLNLETQKRYVTISSTVVTDNQTAALNIVLEGSCAKISGNYLLGDEQRQFETYLTDHDGPNPSTLYCLINQK